jgi:hypothetical protein
MVEQWTFNPFVAGSIPALPTKIHKAFRDESLFSFVAFDSLMLHHDFT